MTVMWVGTREFFFVPTALFPLDFDHPRLASWAAFLRRFAAGAGREDLLPLRSLTTGSKRHREYFFTAKGAKVQKIFLRELG